MTRHFRTCTSQLEDLNLRFPVSPVCRDFSVFFVDSFQLRPEVVKYRNIEAFVRDCLFASGRFGKFPPIKDRVHFDKVFIYTLGVKSTHPYEPNKRIRSVGSDWRSLFLNR